MPVGSGEARVEHSDVEAVVSRFWVVKGGDLGDAWLAEPLSVAPAPTSGMILVAALRLGPRTTLSGRLKRVESLLAASWFPLIR